MILLKDLIIVCAGDFGREIVNIVSRINLVLPTWNLLGFVDDTPDKINAFIDGIPVLGDIQWLETYPKNVYAVCSLGQSKSRRAVVSKFKSPFIHWATLIDPDAKLYNNATVGDGSIICGGSILAINTHVGNHVLVNLNCTLGHDDVVSDYCVINPGVNVSGNVMLGKCVDLGTGSKIIQRHIICENTVIGAGAVVVKDIVASGTYVGVPAQKIK